MESFERLLKYAGIFAEAAGHPRADYMREYMRNRYHSKRRGVVDRLGGKCSRCGTKEGPWHLDHKDKRKKTMRASDLHSVNDEKFEREIKNLQLLCEKCHREKTKESWDYSTPKPRHGTYWMYRKHKCRCNKCVKAYKEKQKMWRQKKKTAEEKRVLDKGKNLEITDPLIDDLLSGITRTRDTLKGKAKQLESLEGNDIPETDLEQVRDLSGNLALLCNMILNGQEYTEEQKTKAILDQTH